MIFFAHYTMLYCIIIWMYANNCFRLTMGKIISVVCWTSKNFPNDFFLLWMQMWIREVWTRRQYFTCMHVVFHARTKRSVSSKLIANLSNALQIIVGKWSWFKNSRVVTYAWSHHRCSWQWIANTSRRKTNVHCSSHLCFSYIMQWNMMICPMLNGSSIMERMLKYV